MPSIAQVPVKNYYENDIKTGIMDAIGGTINPTKAEKRGLGTKGIKPFILTGQIAFDSFNVYHDIRAVGANPEDVIIHEQNEPFKKAFLIASRIDTLVTDLVLSQRITAVLV